MSDVTITALENGPLEVSGACCVQNAAGETLKAGEKMYLCRCGHSANKPFCDGAHKREGFVG